MVIAEDIHTSSDHKTLWIWFAAGAVPPPRPGRLWLGPEAWYEDHFFSLIQGSEAAKGGGWSSDTPELSSYSSLWCPVAVPVDPRGNLTAYVTKRHIICLCLLCACFWIHF